MSVTISISTQKGGVGKTTLTGMVAGQLHYVHALRCLAIDADFPQHSLSGLRDREEKALSTSPTLSDLCRNFYAKHDFGTYPIFKTGTEPHNATASAILSRIPAADLQVILIDLPGSVNQPETLQTLLDVDYFFVPVIPDRVVIESTISFHDLMMKLKSKEEFRDRCRMKDIRYFLTQVDARTKQDKIIEQYQDAFAAAGMRFMDTWIPKSVKFSKETLDSSTIYRSTLLPMTPGTASELHISSLTNEILSICQPTQAL